MKKQKLTSTKENEKQSYEKDFPKELRPSQIVFFLVFTFVCFISFLLAIVYLFYILINL